MAGPDGAVPELDIAIGQDEHPDRRAAAGASGAATTTSASLTAPTAAACSQRNDGHDGATASTATAAATSTDAAIGCQRRDVVESSDHPGHAVDAEAAEDRSVPTGQSERGRGALRTTNPPTGSETRHRSAGTGGATCRRRPHPRYPAHPRRPRPRFRILPHRRCRRDEANWWRRRLPRCLRSHSPHPHPRHRWPRSRPLLRACHPHQRSRQRRRFASRRSPHLGPRTGPLQSRCAC